MGTIREVRKRDGRVVPFDESKIADAIYKAIRSVGKGGRSLAEELASAVSHFLEKKFSRRIPGIEDIQDQVETVLIETGHAEIAKAYILYRNKRASVREVLQVRKIPPELQGTALGPELVEDRVGGSPWSKSKITAALIREADMEAATAEEIASAVERKVFASEIRRISTALIRELVDNELFERGYSAKLFRQAPIGLPKYNLEQILFGTDTKEGYTFPKTPVEVRDFIATQILQQYTLDEVASESVSGAHREGRIHLHRLGDPVRFARLIWDLKAGGAEAPVDISGFFRKLRYLTHFTAGEIRIRRPGQILRSGPSIGDIEGFYERLGEIQTAPPRPKLALELELDRSANPWLQVLSERPLEKSPMIYLSLLEERFSDPVLRSALKVAANLFERGDSIDFIPGKRAWDSPAETPYPTGEMGLLPVAAKITINLPRVAFRSASDRLGRIERELDEVLDIAIKGHLNWRRFLERLGSNPENPLWGILGRPWESLGGRPLVRLQDIQFPIGVVGLNECVKFLTGYELHQDPRAFRAGQAIVERIAGRLKREAAGIGLRFILAESRNAGSLRRLEEIDSMRFRSEIAEIDRGRSIVPGRPAGARYMDGVRIYRLAPVDPLRRIEHLGAFLGYIDPDGMIEDSPEVRNAGGEVILSLLEESLPYLTMGKRAHINSNMGTAGGRR